MKAGSLVWWLYQSPGGYGAKQRVAAVVEKVNPKTIRVKVMRKSPTGWVPERKSVKANRITPREAAEWCSGPRPEAQ